MSRYPEFYLGADGQQYREPAYRLTGPAQLDSIRWEEGEELIFNGIPNENMRPLNAAAERKYIEWMTSLPDAGKARPDDLMQAAWELRGSQPANGDDPEAFKKYQLAVFERALAMKNGLAKRPVDGLEVKAYRPSHEVPPMSNVSLSSGPATPQAPRNGQPRTTTRLPQDQRPKRQAPQMGTVPEGEAQNPTS